MLNLIANTGLEKAIYDIVNPFVSAKGLKIIKIQFHSNRKSTLLIFLDKKDGKITVDECADISMEINSLLDIEDLSLIHI